MDNLPTELLKLVFSFLPDDEFGEYMKVCRSWYSVASERKYNEIMAYPVSSSRYIQNLLSTRIDGSKAINYITVCGFQDWSFNEGDFQELMSCLPNLRVLENIPPTCLPFLNNDVVLGRLPRLEAIIPIKARYSEQSDLLFTINVKLKNQITLLTLAPGSMVEWKDNCEELIATLSTFPILKNLYIVGCYEKCTEAVNLTSILNACKSLVTLGLYNTYNWKIDTEYNIIHTSLTTLELAVGYYTEDHLKCTIRHLPNLETFILSIHKNTFEGVLASANPSIISEAVNYLKNIKHLGIKQMPPNREDGVDGSREVLVFCDFLRTLCGQDCYDCDLQVLVSPRVEHPSITQLGKQNQRISFKCVTLLGSSNYANWVQMLDFLTFRSINLLYNFQHNTQIAQLLDDSSWLLQIFMTLFKHQQHKQLCWIDVNHTRAPQNVQFKNTTKIEEPAERGTICFIHLESKMLHVLGQLFPLVKELALGFCTAEKVKNRDRTYQVDLSKFRQLQQLTFGLDRILENETGEKTLYINIIDVTKAESFIKCYYFSEKTHTLRYHGIRHNYKTKERYLLKIYHAGVKNFTFRKSNVEVIIL